jgi:ADP-heptose:LPS heptosyltransferase
MSELHGIERILAVRLSGIGDVVLLLPVLERLKTTFGGARVTLVTGRQCARAAELSPAIDRVIEIDRPGLKEKPKLRAGRDILRLMRDLRAPRFDLGVDFHGLRETNLIVWASAARYRMGVRRANSGYLSFAFNLEPAVEDPGLHVADMYHVAAENIPGVSGSRGPAVPCLAIPDDLRKRGAALAGSGPTLALYVGASVAQRRWPPSLFAALASEAVARWRASVLVLGGLSPGERAIAEAVKFQAGNDSRIHLLNGLDIPGLAGMIASADLLVSNDSGPMHVGSALGVPTIGLFGISNPDHYAPRGPADAYIKKDSIDEISVDEVIARAEDVVKAFEGRPARTLAASAASSGAGERRRR